MGPRVVSARLVEGALDLLQAAALDQALELRQPGIALTLGAIDATMRNLRAYHIRRYNRIGDKLALTFLQKCRYVPQ